MEKRTKRVLILPRAASNPYVKAKLLKLRLRNFPLTINHCRNDVILQKSRCVMSEISLQLCDKSSRLVVKKMTKFC